MQFMFTGHNIDVTPALKNYAIDKLSHLESRLKNIQEIHVVFEIENIVHIAEATLHIPGHDMNASAESENMYSAIDLLADKLMSQATRLKEKILDHTV